MPKQAVCREPGRLTAWQDCSRGDRLFYVGLIAVSGGVLYGVAVLFLGWWQGAALMFGIGGGTFVCFGTRYVLDCIRARGLSRDFPQPQPATLLMTGLFVPLAGGLTLAAFVSLPIVVEHAMGYWVLSILGSLMLSLASLMCALSFGEIAGYDVLGDL